MRFSANISILFKETTFLERFGRAAELGFSAVEFWWPSGEDLDAIAEALKDADLHVALMNFDAGDMAAGDRGLAGDPERSERFRENVPAAVELARSSRCPRMNVLVGHEVESRDRGKQLALARENVRYAADEAGKFGIEVLVEAVNTFENGPFLLHNTVQAVSFVEAVGRGNVKIQHDLYHMQRMEGNLVANLRENIDFIGHVQVADSPGRGEPGTGEIRYAYVLGCLERLGYSGYVGLEYNPTTSTEESLHWIPEKVRGEDVKVESLGL